MTEEECLRRIQRATAALAARVDSLERDLFATEFHLAAAEWAIAGIVGKSLSVRIDGAHLVRYSAAEVERAIAREAAAELIHRAGLEFRQHAEFYELRARAGVPMQMDGDGRPALPHRFAWPRPYRRAT